MSVLRGALIEYGTSLIGPIPNVVIFQFNPESLSRTLQIPPRPSGASRRETTPASEGSRAARPASASRRASPSTASRSCIACFCAR